MSSSRQKAKLVLCDDNGGPPPFYTKRSLVDPLLVSLKRGLELGSIWPRPCHYQSKIMTTLLKRVSKNNYECNNLWKLFLWYLFALSILLKNFRTSISTLLTMLISATLKKVSIFVRVELKLAKHFPSILMKLFFKKSLEKKLGTIYISE